MASIANPAYYEDAKDKGEDLQLEYGAEKPVQHVDAAEKALGTVGMVSDGHIRLVPTPSSDPNGKSWPRNSAQSENSSYGSRRLARSPEHASMEEMGLAHHPINL